MQSSEVAPAMIDVFRRDAIQGDCVPIRSDVDATAWV